MTSVSTFNTEHRAAAARKRTLFNSFVKCSSDLDTVYQYIHEKNTQIEWRRRKQEGPWVKFLLNLYCPFFATQMKVDMYQERHGNYGF